MRALVLRASPVTRRAYRLEIFDSFGRLRRELEVEAVDDDEAIRQVRPFIGLAAMVLWEGSREVWRYDGDRTWL